MLVLKLCPVILILNSADKKMARRAYLNNVHTQKVLDSKLKKRQ